MMSLNMYKIWNGTRTMKKVVVERSLEEILFKSRGKLALTEVSDIRLVFEKDGTDIEDDDTLAFITKDDVIMVLTSSENWSECTPVETVVNVYTEPPRTEAPSEPPRTEAPSEPPRTEASISETGITPSPAAKPSTSSQGQTVQSPASTRTSTSVNGPGPALPTFSDYVTAKVLAGDSHLVWSKMIGEAAHYYLINYPEMGLDNSSGDYRKVGQAMIQKFPTIARDGTQPWSLFTSSLSQKIRRNRWENARKSRSDSNGPANVSSPKRFRLPHVQSIEDEDAGFPDVYDAHVKEMATEIRKKEPNMTHIKTLLQATQRQRRMWIGGLPGGNVSTILETFPCFRHPSFFMVELKLLLKLSSLKPVFKRFELLFESASSLVKKKNGDDLNSLLFLESETSYRHGKGPKTKSVVQVVLIEETEKVEKVLKSAVDSPPSLIAIKNDGELVNFAIVADGAKILLATSSVPEAVAELMGFYYTTDLAYPRCYSQLLGFIQHVALQQPYDGKKTNGFIQLLKKIKLD